MRISELMEILGEDQGEYGDIEVFFDPMDDMNQCCDFAEIEPSMVDAYDWVQADGINVGAMALVIPIVRTEV